mgnify:FL=1
MLYDFLPAIKIPKSVRGLHYQLTIVNLLVVVLFFIGAATHFEQRFVLLHWKKENFGAKVHFTTRLSHDSPSVIIQFHE